MLNKDTKVKKNSLSRRKFLSNSAIGGAGAVFAGSMLSSINNSAEAAGEPIPLGGGMPMTGWAAADGIEFKGLKRWHVMK